MRTTILALIASLLAFGGEAQAKGGGAANRLTGVSTVNGGPTVTNRDHRGLSGLTTTASYPNYGGGFKHGFKGDVHDHRTGQSAPETTGSYPTYGGGFRHGFKGDVHDHRSH